MTTLLIDQERAEDVFSAICQAHELLRRTFPPDPGTPLLDADNEIGGRVAELEALISQAAKTSQSISELSRRLSVSYESQPIRVGRPAKSLAEKLGQIVELEQQRAIAKDVPTKLALGKQIRRIRRTIITAPALTAQLTPESFYEAEEE